MKGGRPPVELPILITHLWQGESDSDEGFRQGE